ncbi:hypothetical protein ENBRE01_1950 [Enteropsectra breve]|nr:hypothetical protein ENBRE01_1950 [Enteropsectra breve]
MPVSSLYVKLWFYFNLSFMANYTMRLLRVAVGRPFFALPALVDRILLILTYGITVIDLYKRPSKLVVHPNFMCVFLFLSGPHWLLLAPFFVLAVYHSNAFLVKNKKLIPGESLMPLLALINDSAPKIAYAAMVMEVLCIPLSVLLYFLGMSPLSTTFLFCAIIRHQYVHNTTMNEVIGTIVGAVDGWTLVLPPAARQWYTTIKARIYALNTPVKKSEAKK